MRNPDLIPSPIDGFRVEELDGETLLYFQASKKLIYLNESAASVWKLCDGQRTTHGIVEILTKAYPENAVEIDEHVQEAIDSLVREGALRLLTEPSASGLPADSRSPAS